MLCLGFDPAEVQICRFLAAALGFSKAVRNLDVQLGVELPGSPNSSFGKQLSFGTIALPLKRSFNFPFRNFSHKLEYNRSADFGLMNFFEVIRKCLHDPMNMR